MAVQVTGYFQNPQTNLIYESPLLTMIPQLMYADALELIVNIDNNKKQCTISVKMNDIYSSKEATYSTFMAKAGEITQNITEAIKNRLNLNFGSNSDNLINTDEQKNIIDINNLTIKCNVEPDDSLDISIYDMGYPENVIKVFEENNIKTINEYFSIELAKKINLKATFSK